MKRNKLICVTGGIGSGKSVVCNIISALGFPVYDCDSKARRLMDESAEIKQRIYNEISKDAVTLTDDGFKEIKRGVLAQIVFNSEKDLNTLNEITHGVVRNDIRLWQNHHSDSSILFIETAIPFTSGIANMSDKIWVVTASDEVRIERAIRRDNSNRDKVIARINSQKHEMAILRKQSHIPISTISNDNNKRLLPQILNLLNAELTPES